MMATLELPVSKSKKKKTLQIMYPAPYSQSWETDVMPVLMKKNNLGGPRGPKTKRATDSPRTWSQQFPGRPDPTLPHLKYGVFRNRRGLVPRTLAAKPERLPRIERFTKDIKDILPKSIQPAKQTMFNKKKVEPVIRVPKEPTHSYSSSSSTVHVNLANRIEKSRFQPVIVTRTIKESYCRKLCFSNTMHVDIIPKKTGTYNSPSFCPSPHYRSIPRKVSMSPIIKRNHYMRDPLDAIP